MRGIVSCATRGVELASAEGRRDGNNGEHRVMDSLRSIFWRGFVESKRKAGPEEQVQFVNVVDAVC